MRLYIYRDLIHRYLTLKNPETSWEISEAILALFEAISDDEEECKKLIGYFYEDFIHPRLMRFQCQQKKKSKG